MLELRDDGQPRLRHAPVKAYAGIGSRSTPPDVLDLFSSLAYELGKQDWQLRSGAAPGADSAFEQGANESGSFPALFLPWPRFEGRSDEDVSAWGGLHQPQRAAFDIALQFHPRWPDLKQGAQKLHARNVHQILGPDVTTPVLSRFVICWTPGGEGGGGTGQALRIAKHYGVPIFDVAIPEALERVMRFLERS